MAAYTVRYGFRQRFHAPARAAYEWCTDFRPDDAAMAGRSTRRTVERLAPETLILRDLPAPGARAAAPKVRLVHLDPRTMSWTNTHIDGPARLSQFLYRTVPEGRTRSRLDFSGVELRRAARAPRPAALADEARRLRSEDYDLWRRFARVLDAEIGTRAR